MDTSCSFLQWLFQSFSNCVNIFTLLYYITSPGFIGEGITTDDIIGGSIILFACLSNEFNFYDKIVGRKSESTSPP